MVSLWPLEWVWLSVLIFVSIEFARGTRTAHFRDFERSESRASFPLRYETPAEIVNSDLQVLSAARRAVAAVAQRSELHHGAHVLYFLMGFRSGFAAVITISLMAIGCASKPLSENQWRQQKERQQRVGREAGRIGYIGNAGPSVGSMQPSSSMR